MALRRSTAGRFAASLAGFALGVQLVVASWGLALLAAAVDPADALGEHALCLATADARTVPDPATPMPAHVHDGLCCLGHLPPGLQPSAAPAPVPLAYAEISATAVTPAAFIPGGAYNPANARAPPTPA